MSTSMPSWVFGHGSILFRRDFEAAEVRSAVAHGYTRRMGMPSVRNWGRPGWPAPTACLVPGGVTWGRVFAVSPSATDEVYRRLINREARPPVTVTVETPEGPIGAWVWPMDAPWSDRPVGSLALAARVNTEAGGGPSGNAVDYVRGLVDVLRADRVRDLWLEEYVAAVEEWAGPVR